MGFLAPLVLLAAAAAAVPILLHLFHRHEGRRVAFPALRYLKRTEKEHARRIRLRQLLLLALRVAAVLLVVLAGARLYGSGTGGGHEPTALVLIIDNSMSSGLVVGEERMLDRLKALALETVAGATPDDRLWVIRAGEPWSVAPPGGPAEAAERILTTELSAAAGDLGAAISRARELLETSTLQSREIHLLSDLQRSALTAPSGPLPLAGSLPVVVYVPSDPPPSNHFVEEVLVGGGLAPVAGQRSEIVARVETSDPLGDEEEISLRLVIDGRIVAAATASPGTAVILPVGPFPAGPVQGHVEIDPDALRADDRRPFAFTVRPPPLVALAGEGAFFLEQALGVLEEGGRLLSAPASSAGVLFSVGGEGFDTPPPDRATVLLPPADATLLPALNRRLVAAGLPWRIERAEAEGEAQPVENRTPVDLSDVRVRYRFRLVGTGEAAGPQSEVLVRLSNGEPWMVGGTSPSGPYLLVASPFEPEATTLPLSAAMMPLLEWMVSLGSATSMSGRAVEAGTPLTAPPGTTHVRTPGGDVHAVDGTHAFRSTAEEGVYEFLAGERTLDHVAVATPVLESALARLSVEQLYSAVGTNLRLADGVDAWRRSVFVNRQGPELWWPLLALALLLLVLEAWIAAPGRSASPRAPSPGRTPRPDRVEDLASAP